MTCIIMTQGLKDYQQGKKSRLFPYEQNKDLIFFHNVYNKFIQYTNIYSNSRVYNIYTAKITVINVIIL